MKNQNLVVLTDSEINAAARQVNVQTSARVESNVSVGAVLGYHGKVGVLPNEWRNPLDKAHFASRLAFICAETAKSLPPGATTDEIWKAAGPRARREFLEVFKKELPGYELWHCDLFDLEDERIIKNRVDRLYEPKLPVGGMTRWRHRAGCTWPLEECGHGCNN